MRYADDSCRSALLQRLLPLREREPYSAALDMRFASGTQPDPNPLLPYGRFRAANFDRRPSARGRGCVKTRNAIRVRSILFVFQKKTSQNCTWVHQKRIVEALQTRQRGFLHTLGHFATRRSSKCPPHSNGMDAPTLNGIDVPKWKCWLPLKRMGASAMKITTVGIDLAKNLFSGPCGG